jgi:hypothetical protein
VHGPGSRAEVTGSITVLSLRYMPVARPHARAGAVPRHVKPRSRPAARALADLHLGGGQAAPWPPWAMARVFIGLRPRMGLRMPAAWPASDTHLAGGSALSGRGAAASGTANGTATEWQLPLGRFELKARGAGAAGIMMGPSPESGGPTGGPGGARGCKHGLPTDPDPAACTPLSTVTARVAFPSRWPAWLPLRGSF